LKLTTVSKITDLLKESSNPLNIHQIIQGVGYKKTSSSLSGLLHGMVKRGSIVRVSSIDKLYHYTVPLKLVLKDQNEQVQKVQAEQEPLQTVPLELLVWRAEHEQKWILSISTLIKQAQEEVEERKVLISTYTEEIIRRKLLGRLLVQEQNTGFQFSPEGGFE
jgi:hypothetical protein